MPACLHELGVEIEWASLATGDYAIGRTVVVERKSVRDLHGSVIRGRFWPQIGRLRAASLDPYLLVEGVDLDLGPLHPNAIRGCLVAVIDLGVHLLRSDSPRDSARWLERLTVRHGHRAPRRDRPLYAQRPKGVSDGLAPEALLAAIPGISTKSAVALLEEFGTLRAVISAGPQEWAKVKGVGERRARALEAAFGALHPE